MNQEQPRRPQDQVAGGGDQEAIKYEDVFDVSGDLAKQPIAPREAAIAQSAENTVFGMTPSGGVASVMKSVAAQNERAGLVGHRQVSDQVAREGVTITGTQVPADRIATERIGGQVLGQYVQTAPGQSAGQVVAQTAVTIGEALEAASRTAGDKPVDRNDAAAIQVAEQRATGSNVIIPGGLAASAQAAAAYNEGTIRDADKVKLSNVLGRARATLVADKVASRQDAEGVVNAELLNNPNQAMQSGGVAACVTAAARLNENITA